MSLTIAVLSDDIFYVRYLSGVSYYFFNNVLIVTYCVLFICLLSRRWYAWVCFLFILLIAGRRYAFVWAIMQLFKLTRRRRWSVDIAVDWYGLRISVVVDRNHVLLNTYFFDTVRWCALDLCCTCAFPWLLQSRSGLSARLNCVRRLRLLVWKRLFCKSADHSQAYILIEICAYWRSLQCGRRRFGSVEDFASIASNEYLSHSASCRSWRSEARGMGAIVKARGCTAKCLSCGAFACFTRKWEFVWICPIPVYAPIHSIGAVSRWFG